MQRKIDVIASFCNKIAQELIKIQYQENQQAINTEGQLIYYHQKTAGQLMKVKQEEPKTSNIKTAFVPASDIALKMTQAALNISSLYATKSMLFMRLITTKVRPESKKIKSKAIYNFPWNLIYSQSSDSQFDPQAFQQIYEQFRRMQKKSTSRSSIRAVGKKKTIIKSSNLKERRLLLKEQVIKKGSSSQITLEEFKKLARRIYTNKLFRPTDHWCFNFITKHRLDDYVLISFD